MANEVLQKKSLKQNISRWDPSVGIQIPTVSMQ